MSAKREEIMNGLIATGQTIAEIFAEVLPESEMEGAIDELMAYLNTLTEAGARDELKVVVWGALQGLGVDAGIEPT
jgi:hypothetical protein